MFYFLNKIVTRLGVWNY